MHRRSFVINCVAAATVASFAALDARAIGPAIAVARVRSCGRSPTRTSRGNPVRQPSATPVPSYMRADSKARGRFGP